MRSDVHKGDDSVQNMRVCCIRSLFKESGTRIGPSILQSVEYSTYDTQHQQDQEIDDNVEVGLLFDFALLGRSVSTIQHDLRVGSREDDETYNPGCVANGTAT